MSTPDSTSPGTATPIALLADFLDEHRSLLGASLDGLTEEEARRRLVPSRTTLLGLVKHATFVERVWFEEARTGTPRRALGLPENAEDSFVLDPGDTIASIRAAHRAAYQASQAVIADLSGEEIWSGNRRGPLPVPWILLHVLRELAQHAGHADILREQILAARR
ncbi:DinB family protein [Brachybacterium sp. J153]|uniref:DinB family protein n=1 Tax=Brachybacterium sp. J153 TaxID=3116488 RepID=UPI002E7A1EBC|nr:DinB family protein [Brachybacterium sp. J153]MEE1616903.1 DinB family protein [Brachybacterium sp. J153]